MIGRACAAALAAAALAACTTPPPPPPPAGPPPAPPPTAVAPLPAPDTPSPVAAAGQTRYRCDNGTEFTVRFGDGSATLDAGPRGADTLLRDAGGLTPQHTVYSSTKLKAEFGLGADGRAALLRYAVPAAEVRCMRE